MGQTFAGIKTAFGAFADLEKRGRSEKGAAISGQHICCNMLSLTSEDIIVSEVNKINSPNDM